MKELVTDLVITTKQVGYLIQSLPEPEAEEVRACPFVYGSFKDRDSEKKLEGV